ncbi:MAG: diguanylate cyclase, partial [Bdellovibrionaceae bacterium]|nr:diguanylate cyclase [Pseudobdellovibrionaceae bacterium]
MKPLTTLLFFCAFLVFQPDGLAQNPLETITTPSACAAQLLSGRDFKCDSSTWYGRALENDRRRCQELVNSSTCKELVRIDPILADGLRQCDIKAICSNSTDVVGFFKGCASGFTLGTGEGLDSVKTWFENASKRIQEGHTAYGTYANTIEYKRELVRPLPSYKDTTDRDLEKRSAAALLVERQNYDTAVSRAERSGAKSLFLSERAERAETEDRRRLQAAELPIQETAIFGAAYEALRKKGIELSCLDSRTRAEMICWGAAYIVDPIAVATLALRSGRIAKVTIAKLEEIHTRARRHPGELKGGDTRNFEARPVDVKEAYGVKIADDVIKGLPPSMNVARYRNALKEEFLVFERTVKMPDGSTKVLARELPFDGLTGAIDANLPAGRQFLETTIAEANGKVTLAMIDVDNLGFVSKNFTHGKTGTPAELKQIARAAGDEYLKATAKVIADVSRGKAQFFRTGGDEFALVINETDPAKVQKLLQEINERVRKDPSVRRVFTEESKARAAAIKHEVGAGNTMSESQAQSYRLGYAPYSQPNVSVGSVVVNGEDVPHAFEIAERQAAKQKIENKTEFKSDTTKYGGSKPSPDAKPNLTYLADAQPSAIGRAGNQNRVGTSVKDAQGFVAQERVRERFRVGEIAIVEYKDELGKPLLQMERYYTDAIGERHFVTHEVFVNERTGLIDARHPRGREILNTFVASTKTPNRGGVWVNLENLGVLNYGAGGTINGDRALAATSEAIKRVIRDDNLPIKWQGSEFFIGVENVAPSELKFVTERIQTALAKDPSIKKIYDQYT